MKTETINLIARFFAKENNIDSPKEIFAAREIWSSVYNQHRIKKSFMEADVLANEAVIKYFIKDELPTHDPCLRKDTCTGYIKDECFSDTGIKYGCFNAKKE